MNTCAHSVRFVGLTYQNTIQKNIDANDNFAYLGDSINSNLTKFLVYILKNDISKKILIFDKINYMFIDYFSRYKL